MYDATLPLSPLQRVLDLKPAFKVYDKFKKLEVGSVGSFSLVLRFHYNLQLNNHDSNLL